jgi:hypothetical protein
MPEPLPKNIILTESLLSTIWTTGFQSGLNVGAEISHEDVEFVEDDKRVKDYAQQRAHELFNKDSDAIITLINLQKQMES